MFDFPISANPPIGIFFRRTVFITFVHGRMFKTTAHTPAPPHRIPAFHMQGWNPITFSSFRGPAAIFLLHPSRLFRLPRQHNHHTLFMHGLIVNSSPIFFYPRMIFHSDAIDVHIVIFLRYITSEFIDFR